MTDRFGARHWLLLLLLFFGLSFFLAPQRANLWDLGYYRDWTRFFLVRGVNAAYEARDMDYGPFMVYLLTGLGWLFGTPAAIADNILYFRQFFFLFDLSAIFVAMRLFARFGLNPFRAFLILFNLAYIYNSLTWGQADGMFSALVLLALVMALMGKLPVAGVLYVLALNLKPQPIVYLPLFVLLLVPWMVRARRQAFLTLVLMGAVQLWLLLPFLRNGAWRTILDKYGLAARSEPVVSSYAHNLWALLIPGDLTHVPDTLLFMGLALRTWGVVLFAIFGLAVLVPVALRAAHHTLAGTRFTRRDLELVLLAAGLIALGLFFFNTQMHERYVFPIVLFWGMYAVLARDYLIYILVSVAHLLNVQASFDLFGYGARALPFLFSPPVAAFLFSLCALLGMVRLYRLVSLREEFAQVRGLLTARNPKIGSAVAFTNSQ